MLFALLAACASIGPGTIPRDRFEYTNSVADSWKEQMLLNIVKIRYGDAPIFLEVASIINQYSLEGQVNAAFGWSHPPSTNSQLIGGAGRYYDRPTVTYSLLTGEKFARSLMSPVKPASVLSLVEGGYPIDLVFKLLLHSINGIRNGFGGSARARQADPEFFPLLEKLRRIQNSGAVALRVKKMEDKEAVVMVFRQRTAPEIEEMGREVRRTLGLKEEGGEFRVVYGSSASGDEEIALLTRSILEILSDISATIEVPPGDVAEKRVNSTMAPEGEGIRGHLIRILYAEARPADAFVSVPYRDRWFWIDDRDYGSKKLFSFLMFVMTLTETGGKEGAPVLTISTGN